MRHGSNPLRSRSQSHTRLNWRSVVSTELVYGLGLSVLALTLAWPTRSEGMRDLKSASDTSAEKWGRVQAVAMGTSTIFPSQRNTPHQAQSAGWQEKAGKKKPELTVAVPDAAPHLLLPGVELLKPIGEVAKDENSSRASTTPPATSDQAVPVPTQLVERQTPVVHAANQQVAPRQGRASAVVNVGWLQGSEAQAPVVQAHAGQSAAVIEQGRHEQERVVHHESPGLPPIPESQLKLDPPPADFFDEQALAEIVSVRARLGGSVLDMPAENSDQHGEVRTQDESSSGGETGFIELLRGVLKRSGDSIPWRPLNVRPTEERESATVMTPTIVFEEVRPGFEAAEPIEPFARNEFAVTVAGYHVKPSQSQPSSQVSPAGADSAPESHLVQRLRDWSRELDEAAADAEDRGDFARADSLRELAQEIRMEARGMETPGKATIRENLPVRQVILQSPGTTEVDTEPRQRLAPRISLPRSGSAADPTRPNTADTPTPWLTVPHDPQQQERALRRLRRIREIEASQQGGDAQRD